MSKNCKFCSKFNYSNNTDQFGNFDTILYETKNFVVTPTIGSLVEGWVLVTSKSHYISVGDSNLSLKNELEDIISTLKATLSEFYPEVFVFEHGPCTTSQSVGCGIDHLHVHVVPLNFNLLDKAKQINSYKWIEVSTIFSAIEYVQQNLAYLFIENTTGQKYIATDKNIPSQFFRKVIADQLGTPQLFDWKINKGECNIQKTVNLFNSVLQFS